MTTGAIESVRADREALLEICAGLEPPEWKAESGCPGWSVQDVIAHMGTLYWMVVDQSALPDVSGLPTERVADVLVESRRGWSADRVVEDYRSVSLQAIEALEGLATQDFEMAFGDLGTYRAATLPHAFSFDHFVHIRYDLFTPRGPLPAGAPPSDETRVAAALDWVEAALPQQNTAALAGLPGAVDLVIEGPAPRRLRAGSGQVVGVVTSEGPAFLLWVTQRGSWEELGVVASGDQRALAITRGLKVF